MSDYEESRSSRSSSSNILFQSWDENPEKSSVTIVDNLAREAAINSYTLCGFYCYIALLLLTIIYFCLGAALSFKGEMVVYNSVRPWHHDDLGDIPQIYIASSLPSEQTEIGAYLGNVERGNASTRTNIFANAIDVSKDPEIFDGPMCTGTKVLSCFRLDFPENTSIPVGIMGTWGDETYRWFGIKVYGLNLNMSLWETEPNYANTGMKFRTSRVIQYVSDNDLEKPLTSWYIRGIPQRTKTMERYFTKLDNYWFDPTWGGLDIMFGSKGKYQTWIESAHTETDDELDPDCVIDKNNIAKRCTLNANYIRAGTERVANIVRADHPWFFVVEKTGGLHDGFFLTSLFFSTIIVGVYKWIQKGNVGDCCAAAGNVLKAAARESQLSRMSVTTAEESLMDDSAFHDKSDESLRLHDMPSQGRDSPSGDSFDLTELLYD